MSKKMQAAIAAMMLAFSVSGFSDTHMRSGVETEIDIKDPSNHYFVPFFKVRQSIIGPFHVDLRVDLPTTLTDKLEVDLGGSAHFVAQVGQLEAKVGVQREPGEPDKLHGKIEWSF